MNESHHPSCHGARVSLATGTTTCEQGERFENAMRRADARRYDAKRQHCASTPNDRRR